MHNPAAYGGVVADDKDTPHMSNFELFLLASLQIFISLAALSAIRRLCETAERNLWLTSRIARYIYIFPIYAFIVLNVFGGLFPVLGVTELLARTNASNGMQQAVIMLSMPPAALAWFSIILTPVLLWVMCCEHRSFAQWRVDTAYALNRRRIAATDPSTATEQPKPKVK